MKRLSMLMLTLAMLAGCSAVESDTRLFAVGAASSAGFDAGVEYAAEQRVKIGPLMVVGGGSYSPTLKKDAEDGYQYGADVGARYYIDELFAGAGHYWSGYRMEFADGRVWEKDARNWTWTAGWDGGPWEIALTGSPKESQSPNRVAFIGLSAERRFFEAWLLTFGITRLTYDQGGNRETGWTPKLGVGFEF